MKQCERDQIWRLRRILAKLPKTEVWKILDDYLAAIVNYRPSTFSEKPHEVLDRFEAFVGHGGGHGHDKEMAEALARRLEGVECQDTGYDPPADDCDCPSCDDHRLVLRALSRLAMTENEPPG